MTNVTIMHSTTTFVICEINMSSKLFEPVSLEDLSCLLSISAAYQQLTCY